MKTLFCASLLAFAAPAAGSALAQDVSPVGLWKNIDDATGKPKALIRITENNGEVRGQIEKLFLMPGDNPHPRCDKCQGTNKDQPVLGMVFMSGLRKNGDIYTGGEILDPDSGKVYRSKLTLVDGGKKVLVRGYVGVPMLGRSQTWVRQD